VPLASSDIATRWFVIVCAAVAQRLAGSPLWVGPATTDAPPSIRATHASIHSGAGRQSSSVKHRIGAIASSAPTLRAAAGPRPLPRTTRACDTRETTDATAAGSADASSTTRISNDDAVWRASASRHAASA
jgi:hypothetical protein